MKRVAILQSNYIPWKGYFDLIAAVDEFIFYEDVQYTRADWRNRNRIKTPHGAQWLSVPVGDSVHRLIRDVAIRDPDCGKAHWKRLVSNYSRAASFKTVAQWLEPLYCETPWTMLSVINRVLIEAICRFLGITTQLRVSSDYDLSGDRNGRLVSLCRQAGASVYLSGPSARSYIDVAAFRQDGVEVSWFEYAGYPEYPQLWGPFVHEVSVLDLLFNCGPDAMHYMKHATR
jgi:WbqC-like protein family